MAIPVVANTTTFADGANATSRNLAVPSGSGGWFIIGVAIDGTAAINTPSGFDLVYARTDTQSSSNMAVFKRKADGTEGANFTISTGSEIACGFASRITGCDSTDCIDVLSDWTGTPDTQSTEDVGVYPPVYAECNDSLILRITGWDDGTTTITNPSGHTEIANVGANSSGAKLQACTKDKATAGYEAAASFAVSDATELGSAVTIAIRSTSTPAAYPAQPVIRCGSYNTPDGTNSTALIYQKPYGTVDGDLLLLVQTSDTASNLSPPGAFTSIQDTNNGTAIYHQAYYRVASSEGSSYAGSSATTNAKLGALMRIVNANPSAPINQSSAATGTSATPTASTITPSVNNCLLLFTMGCDDDEVAFGSGAPTGYDIHYGISNEEGLDVGLIIARDEQTTAGATGSVQSSITASEEWVALNIAIAPSTTGASGSAATTEAADTASGSGTETITGTAAPTETNDTASASGLAGIRGSVATQAASDTAASSGTETFTGTVAASEANDTASGTATEVFTGTAAITEVADTADAAGLAGIRGSIATTSANHTAEASGLETITGTASVTGASDTASASGEVTSDEISGSASVTAAAHTAAGTGTEIIAGSATTTEAADIASASGTLAITGTGAATEAADSASGSGAEIFTGTASSSAAADTASGSGTLTITGSATATEAADTASGNGALLFAGTGEATEANDTASGTGSAASAITGAAAIIAASDTAFGTALTYLASDNYVHDVPAETRSATIEADGRVVTVVAQTRADTVAVDTRSSTITSDTRTHTATR